MNNDVIGFKLADGSFYPVFQEGTAVERQLELTTVRDDQTTIQLHLYKSPTGSMEDAAYVSTLILENLMPHPKEEPSLALKVALDDEGNLSAEILDPETGSSSSTNVSLVTLDEATLHGLTDDMPTMSDFSIDDFSLPADESPAEEFSLPADDFSLPADDFSLPTDDISAPADDVQEESFDIDFADDDFDTSAMDSSDQFKFDDIPDFGEIPETSSDPDFGNPIAASFGDDDFFEESLAEERRSQRRFRIPVIICIVCAIISVIVLAIILWLAPSRVKVDDECFQEVEEPEVVLPVLKEEDLTKARENEIVVSPVPVVPEPPKKADPEPAPVETAPAVPAVTTAPEPAAPAPAPVKKEPQSVRYKLKWGDTLWDLADAYYRNPWQYKKIARWNGIKNPDYIIAGTYIYIPE